MSAVSSAGEVSGDDDVGGSGDVSGPGGDPFASVVGQPAAVALLRQAAEHPVHAYLLVGATGWGTRVAARAFAGELLAAADPEGAARHRSLAASEHHPSIRVVERVGASISADQARDIVRQAALSPPEGSRQVIVAVDFHLVGQQAPILLKTIEEPPASTYFIILAEEVPPELETIASRCVRVDFGPVPLRDVEAALVAEGVDPGQATLAARSAAGDLDRARLLVSDPNLAARHALWWGAPGRLDGTGSTVAALAGEILGAVDELLAPLQTRQEAEMAAAVEQVETFGGTKGSLANLEARHKRETRRVRTDELHACLATLGARYRDEAGSTSGRAAFVRAGELLATAAERLVFNVNERLLLEWLLLSLPPLRSGEG